jgi:hypothetical protein
MGIVRMLRRDCRRSDGAEDVPAEQQLGEHDAEREEVGPGVGHRVAGLLGREVFVLARDDLAFLVVHEVEGLRDAEVGELHVALVGDEDVLRADVAMDDVEVAALAVASSGGRRRGRGRRARR